MDSSSPSLTLHLLSAFLPADLVATINNHILDPSSPVQVLQRGAVAQLQHLLSAAYPVLQPLFERLLDAMAENQGLVGVIASLLVLATVLVVLNWIRRLLMWWTRLALRVASWAALVAIAAWVWDRGVFESARDVAVGGGKIVGYLAFLKDVWVDEYNRYEAQQGMAGAQGRSSGR
ncbi:hypothetical protein EDB81DRAFT_181106 [Dactylonectria macrodidyma]|uniref:Nuclear pore assembly and biogenesis-domain-containing protein n=1 Tax=Dactylonectria macrodidyma TaxID=307937 RepID=A0A9P9FPS7_9HYPO|nr:hypothetical protein EDB81DRAFT_181106 [Dactylonectria macrodidyma]